VIAFLTLLLTAPLPTPDRDRAVLARAVQMYEALDSEKARQLLLGLLANHPAEAEAARAHLYLGLIAIDGIQLDVARSELRKALTTDPTLELPFSASPKAHVVFGQVRQEINGAALSFLGVPAEQTSGPMTSSSPARPIPASFWISLGIGAGAAAMGVGLGVASQLALSSAQQASGAGDTQRFQNLSTGERIGADVCFGTVIVAGVVATVAFFLRGEAPAGAGP
jgi:hypothetical protein